MRARAALEASGAEVLPLAVTVHALQSSWIPRTNRAAVDAYWRAHPVRAERLSRLLASRSGAPPDWAWRIGDRSEERRVGKECRSRGWSWQGGEPGRRAPT